MAIYALGYYIFRSANSEKDAFRTDPNSPAVSLPLPPSQFSV
jgi:delta14-sterol reductase